LGYDCSANVRYYGIMGRKEVYEARMKELGLTAYQLAKKVVELRQARGEDANFTSIESSIRKCLKDPNGRATYINDDIVKAMDGETVIRWKSLTETTV
jgi:hypothetical protein